MPVSSCILDMFATLVLAIRTVYFVQALLPVGTLQGRRRGLAVRLAVDTRDAGARGGAQQQGGLLESSPGALRLPTLCHHTASQGREGQPSSQTIPASVQRSFEAADRLRQALRLLGGKL